MKIILITSILAMVISIASIVIFAGNVLRKAKRKEIAARYFRIFMAVLIIMISACASKKEFKKQNPYLVTVEKNKSFDAVRFSSSEKVDSLVINDFQYIKNFESDSIFQSSPYFIIETINLKIYGEKK